jgi:hypothetical protein
MLLLHLLRVLYHWTLLLACAKQALTKKPINKLICDSYISPPNLKGIAKNFNLNFGMFHKTPKVVNGLSLSYYSATTARPAIPAWPWQAATAAASSNRRCCCDSLLGHS